MPKGLKISNRYGTVLFDSSWITGVDYDNEQFEDEDYDVVCQQLKGDGTKTFDQCVNRICKREPELEKAHQNKFDKAPSSSGDIPSIQGYILYKVELEHIQKAIIKWRGVWNSEQRHITSDEFSSGKQDFERGSKEREGGKNCNAKGST